MRRALMFVMRGKGRLERAYDRGHFDGAQCNEPHSGRLDTELYALGFRHGSLCRRRIFARLVVVKVRRRGRG